MLKFVDKIYVCHYSKLVDRVDILKNQLDFYNLEVEWILDFDREKINFETLKDILPKFDENFNFSGISRKLRLPEISIMLKHYFIWKEMVKNNIQISLILEDDVIFVDDFVNKFNNQITNLDSNFDFVWIGSCCDMNLPFAGKHLIKNNTSRCAHGYLLSLKAANTLIDNIKYNNFPVDFFFNNLIDNLDMNSYWMEPDLIRQNPIFETSIQNKY